ncbi:zinc finger transcriptional activator [Coniosporium tulheliwenetii]|uniref:Zinc finger transcriptional activator n=1 Tax=Coniosporium tulheliwenetii TaxID=3383036 RepID=A0ACC2YQZ7_9PEZI|nr:zinc finger transcriptional activator [Cladosporium sp. JES 115]
MDAAPHIPSGTDSNASPPPRTSAQPHTRTYQACIPCRRRKVRCDLGPVDNPHDPPCVRCRRESKECFFSATRRKRKSTAPGEEYDEADLSDYEIRNGRKRLRSAPNDVTPPSARRPEPIQISQPSIESTGVLGGQQPLTPGGSIGRYQPLRRPTETQQQPNDEEDQQVSNEAASILQTKEVFSGHDALNLLFEATQQQNNDFGHHRTGSTGSMHRPSTVSATTPGSQTMFTSPRDHLLRTFDPREQPRSAPEAVLDPAITRTYTNGTGVADEEASFHQAIKAWSRFRFVRAGWFTAREGIAYIEYFYQYLSPLTPIVVPDFRHHSTHVTLLSEEPMLAVTMLTVASRFMKLAGPGASSRPYAIHEKLWTYLQGMIDRMIWGQEQHGGGFCGAGAQAAADVNPLSRKGLRTLGTIESLMLLTEWHPRAMHFPPHDSDDDLLLPEDNDVFTANGLPAFGEPPELLKGKGGQRIDSWLEPCWRSDRLCWMLLGNALALAYEIGVFDESGEAEFQHENQNVPIEKVHSYYRRRNHLKDLLLVYRLISLWALDQRSPSAMGDLLRSPPPFQRVEMRGSVRGLPARERTHDLVLDLWKHIAILMETGNQQMFPNRRQTRDLIKSGRYVELLQFFQPKLREWRRSFEKASSIPTHMRHILTIEFEYTRVYLNSLALQARPTPKSETGAIPFSTLMKWYGTDRPYINEVIDACRNVLRVVVEGLHPGDYLKHAPVRTYFRIISVAIILLKTFALGATEDDVAISLGLMDRAVEALRTCIVDDVHVGNRFADLLDTLTNRIRSRFVRMAPSGGVGVSRAGSRSPILATGLQTPMMPPPSGSGGANGLPNPGQWSNYAGVPSSPQANTGTGGRATPHPLWGISTEAYDPQRNDISIMPPPTFNFASNTWDLNFGNGNNNNVSNGQFGNGMGDDSGGGYMPDWLALPLDPLLNSYGADVTQTTYGPDVGGYDLLDVLLNGMDGSLGA